MTATDTFADFVEHLSDALDESEVGSLSGEEWAARLLAHVHSVVAADRLDDTFVDAICVPAAVFTYGGMIAHVLTFAAHRRTLVSLALMRHGIDELGWGDPMLWVAGHA